MTDNRTALVEMRDICISFGGIQAVDNVSIDLFPGEVVGLLGHNGAGKSTLIKILSGAYAANSGEILVNGTRAEIHSPRDARRYNIETIYQTLALADNLNAAQNLFLGRELTTPAGFVDDDAMEAEARQIMKRLNRTSKSSRPPSAPCRAGSASPWRLRGPSISMPGSSSWMSRQQRSVSRRPRWSPS